MLCCRNYRWSAPPGAGPVGIIIDVFSGRSLPQAADAQPLLTRTGWYRMQVGCTVQSHAALGLALLILSGASAGLGSTANIYNAGCCAQWLLYASKVAEACKWAQIHTVVLQRNAYGAEMACVAFSAADACCCNGT